MGVKSNDDGHGSGLGMDRYRRFNRRRADAEAFFARRREEVMRDLAINWKPTTKAEASNIIDLNSYRAARRRRP
jgi:hypothetical protein